MALKFNPFTSNFDFVNKTKSIDLIYGRVNIPIFQDYIDVDFSPKATGLNTPILLSIETDDNRPIFLNYLIKQRSASTFTVYFNAPVDSANYYLNYYIAQNAMATMVQTGKESIPPAQNFVDVVFDYPMTDINYFITASIENNHSIPIFSNFVISDKTLFGARIKFNAVFDTINYNLLYSVIY